ncbi:hypothetical protein CYLTODRAFT_453094 [Cylindrobasidium torrendii FP15055 ss-10]|uniref:Uncharacterized protein n=1 Tax=Cylindrobasidium torrendii FP15055 ss-10 TaxID=1314674 RepID=A0A0D7BFS2_9AGAR|nr:hypothetical protein CYLTODRAFT_453094 [Cylindrobasidium torrendii FP15055 ss-10]
MRAILPSEIQRTRLCMPVRRLFARKNENMRASFPSSCGLFPDLSPHPGKVNLRYWPYYLNLVSIALHGYAYPRRQSLHLALVYFPALPYFAMRSCLLVQQIQPRSAIRGKHNAFDYRKPPSTGADSDNRADQDGLLLPWARHTASWVDGVIRGLAQRWELPARLDSG